MKKIFSKIFSKTKPAQSGDWLTIPNCAIAKAMCEACGEGSMSPAKKSGNEWRWQDYIDCVEEFKECLIFNLHERKE
jgi:hypothetical protein